MHPAENQPARKDPYAVNLSKGSIIDVTDRSNKKTYGERKIKVLGAEGIVIGKKYWGPISVCKEWIQKLKEKLGFFSGKTVCKWTKVTDSVETYWVKTKNLSSSSFGGQKIDKNKDRSTHIASRNQLHQLMNMKEEILKLKFLEELFEFKDGGIFLKDWQMGNQNYSGSFSITLNEKPGIFEEKLQRLKNFLKLQEDAKKDPPITCPFSLTETGYYIKGKVDSNSNGDCRINITPFEFCLSDAQGIIKCLKQIKSSQEITYISEVDKLNNNEGEIKEEKFTVKYNGMIFEIMKNDKRGISMCLHVLMERFANFEKLKDFAQSLEPNKVCPITIEEGGYRIGGQDKKGGILIDDDEFKMEDAKKFIKQINLLKNPSEIKYEEKEFESKGKKEFDLVLYYDGTCNSRLINYCKMRYKDTFKDGEKQYLQVLEKYVSLIVKIEQKPKTN